MDEMSTENEGGLFDDIGTLSTQATVIGSLYAPCMHDDRPRRPVSVALIQ